MIEWQDNFLEPEAYEEIKNIMLSDEMPWYFVSDITFDKQDSKGNLFYMTHEFYTNHRPCSPFFDKLIPQFLDKLDIKSLIRVKGNLYPGQQNLSQHDKHFDYEFPHLGAIYYLNDNDGYTMFGDKLKVDSIGNRMVIFDASKQHASTDCTNAKARVNINFNFLG